MSMSMSIKKKNGKHDEGESEKHESLGHLKWAIPTSISTEAQKSNFQKGKSSFLHLQPLDDFCFLKEKKNMIKNNEKLNEEK